MILNPEVDLLIKIEAFRKKQIINNFQNKMNNSLYNSIHLYGGKVLFCAQTYPAVLFKFGRG